MADKFVDILNEGFALRCIKLHADRNIWQRPVDLYGRIYFIQDSHKPLDIVDIVVADANDEVVNPFLTIENDSAQEFMDALWNCGVRPSEHIRRQMDSGFNHLEDMRKIVFASLKKLELDV